LHLLQKLVKTSGFSPLIKERGHCATRIYTSCFGSKIQLHIIIYVRLGGSGCSQLSSVYAQCIDQIDALLCISQAALFFILYVTRQLPSAAPYNMYMAAVASAIKSSPRAQRKSYYYQTHIKIMYSTWSHQPLATKSNSVNFLRVSKGLL
jgi:hypothetical protein